MVVKGDFMKLRFVLTLTSASILLWQIHVGFDRWRLKETSTINSVKPNGQVTLPSFTLCPSFNTRYKADVLASYGLERSAFYTGKYASNGSEKDSREIFEEATYDLSELVKRITVYQGWKRVDIGVQNDDPTNYEWKPKIHVLFGRCYSLEMRPNLTRFGLNEMIVESKAGLFVFIHHPGQFLSLDSNVKLPAELGERMYNDVVFEVTVDTLGPEAEVSCYADSDEGFDECLMDAIPGILESEFGCSVPFLPKTEKLCDAKNVSLLLSVQDKYDDLVRNGRYDVCGRPCSIMETLTGFPFSGKNKPSEGYVKIYFKSVVKQNKIVLAYKWDTMIAEIGGYTGLLLGISVLDAAKLLEMLLRKFATDK